MKNKTCGECRIYDHFHNLCVIGGDIEPTETAKGCFEPKIITNGDKIRQMTNSQLSKFLARISNCNVCFPDNSKGDRKWWYDWTFKPAESEGNNG